MDINDSAGNAARDRFAQVKEKWWSIVRLIDEESMMKTIVCNLAFELFFVSDAFSIAAPENESLTADTLLSECETFIDALGECTERTYYRSAVNEIKLIERIVEHAEIGDNLLPHEDLGRRIWATANTAAFIPMGHLKGCRLPSSRTKKDIYAKNPEVSTTSGLFCVHF